MKLIDMPKKQDSDVQDTLQKALEMKFDSVIVFGFKDGQIYTQGSGSKNRLEVLGALEAAKQEYWK